MLQRVCHWMEGTQEKRRGGKREGEGGREWRKAEGEGEGVAEEKRNENGEEREGKALYGGRG